jgi:diamine N-acetyltransferase
MTISVATKDQLTIVKELAHKIWPDAYSEILSVAQLEYMLENFYAIPSLEAQFEAGHIFLLAEEKGEYLGFAAFELNCKTTPKTKLHKLYVLPSTQGTGLGKMFLEVIENCARQANNTHLFLNVNKYNKAQRFYEKQNFEIILEEVIPIGNDYIMDDYVMEKKL